MSISSRLKSKFNEEVVGPIMGPPFNALDEIIGWIDLNLDPEEVFHGHRLESWAYDNGFKKFE